MKILFLQTGGTIDKDYQGGDDHHGYTFTIGPPAFERILSRAKTGFDYEAKLIIQKDSLDIDDEDRKRILQTCAESPIKNIIITHGTDTMLETAQVLSSLKNKIIILTGSLSPELFKNTDADFNVGSAVGAIPFLTDGVYLAMSGVVTDWQKMTFDKESGRFVVKQF